MSVFHENMLIGSSGQGGATAYTIQRSLRFDSASSSYLSRTPSSAGNRKTWTWSGWVKRSALGVRQCFFSSTPSGTVFTEIEFNSSDQLVVYISGVTPSTVRQTSAVYRDPSAWLHIVLSVDTTQATASNRVRLYVNGAQVTAFAASADPAQNHDTQINAAQAHAIGSSVPGGGTYFSGYIADIHFIDGQALDPTSFGEFDANNVWQPKAYTGTYGTNGFKLDFSDNSNNTATTLGKDSSGNGNNWTPNNLSVTAGAGNDSLVDTPTSYGTDTGAGGEVSGNYCTLNPLAGSGSTLSNGNLDITATNAGSSHYKSTIATASGKWYFEATLTSGASSTDALAGVSTIETAPGTYPGQVSTSYAAYAYNANSYLQKVNNGAFTNLSATTFATNDILGVAVDLDNGKIWFSKNGTWTDSGNPATGANAAFTGLSGTFTPVFRGSGAGAASGWIVNFGQKSWAYTAPSGFKALCTANLPTPAISNGATAMDVALWTGNGSARSITGLNFNPDLVWIKGRSGATDHAIYDSVRGAEKRLESNNTDSEVTSDGGVTAFNSDGFSLGTLAQVNTNSATYAGWCWDAGTSTVTNTSGSISSQVRANTSAGFSVVTASPSGASDTFGHGLGVTPSWIISKRRNGTGAWYLRTSYLANPGSHYLILNNTAAVATDTAAWANTAASSTVITVNASYLYGGSADIVCYCFAPIAGFSAFGSYTGNGSADGAFIYTGHRSRWLLIRRTDSAENWILYDTARNPYNIADNLFLPNSSSAELLADGSKIDILSNGFKNRTTSGGLNANGGTYVYASFSEHPFSLARAR